MDGAARKRWTQTEFLDWAERQDAPFEFDGFEPVAMTGGTKRHDFITTSLAVALRQRLRGKPCSNHGPNLGVETTGSKIRYPDALVTCTKFSDDAKLAPAPVVIFEVVSPTSGHVDRILKAREYAAIPSVRYYIIAESESPGITVLSRTDGASNWNIRTLVMGDILALPELEIDIPVSEFYEGVTFPPEQATDR